MRIYRYTVDSKDRVAIHLPAGASSLDINLDETRHLAAELMNLAAPPLEYPAEPYTATLR